MNFFQFKNQSMVFREISSSSEETIIWCHGWGRDSSAMVTIANSFALNYNHYFIDFPGFGLSPVPKESWDVSDYAEYMYNFLQSIKAKRKIWIAHSFGCRVGIKIASMYPNALDELVLISAAGLFSDNICKNIYYGLLKFSSFFLKKIISNKILINKLKKLIGSIDYLCSGEMKAIFLNVINEDLSLDASIVKNKVLLIYGKNDKETPISFGKRFSLLMKNSTLILLEDYDHLNILTSGSYIVAFYIKRFISENDN